MRFPTENTEEFPTEVTEEFPAEDTAFFLSEDGTITDYVTGLMWQKSGSENRMKYEKAEEYIRKLNQEKFAGYTDWHLPTVPEFMSLLEPNEKNGDLYIDPVFDKTQGWCWSSDKTPSSWEWYVNFIYGGVPELLAGNGSCYVRGVRSR